MGETTQEKNQIIYGDWYILKGEIWTSWFAFLEDLAVLGMYNQQDKESPRAYLSTIRYFHEVFNKIGKPKFKQYLTKKEYQELIKIYQNTLNKRVLNLMDFEKVKDILNIWFQKSGMGDINKKQDNPNNSIIN